MDPTRFLDTDEDRFESRLLGSARGDAPPHGALKRAEAALGFGVTAGMVAAAAATSTAKAATAHGAAQSVAQVGAASVVKWLGIGLVSGVVVTGGLSYGVPAALPSLVAPSPPATSNDTPSQNRRSPRKAAHRAAPAETPAVTPEPLPPPPAPAAQEVESTPIAPSVAPERRAAPSSLGAVGAEPKKSAPTPTLSVELAILERARRALLAQRPEAVLRELDSYARARRTGVFDSEAEILAMEALLQQGNVAAASARAARALERAPSGPHAARLREIVALGKP